MIRQEIMHCGTEYCQHSTENITDFQARSDLELWGFPWVKANPWDELHLVGVTCHEIIFWNIKKTFTKQQGFFWCQLVLRNPWHNRYPELMITRGPSKGTPKIEADKGCAAYYFPPLGMWTLGWRLTVLSAHCLYQTTLFPLKFLSLSSS